MIVFDKNTFGSNRELDSNGFLRVDECNISKCQVRPYLGREIPNWREFGLEPDKIYNVYCPKEELEKAIPTFNNLPLTREHIEVDVENVPKEKIVGSLGDHASFEYPYLKNNLIIYDKKDIDLVMSGKKKELSCGYRYTPVQQSGEVDGQHYDFVMRDIIGNHVALVKQGRAGRDVMVADSSKGILETIKEKIMAVFDNDVVGDEFKESEHPRAKNGQFTSKAGGSSESEKIKELEKQVAQKNHERKETAREESKMKPETVKARWEKEKKDAEATIMKYEKLTKEHPEAANYKETLEGAKKRLEEANSNIGGLKEEIASEGEKKKESSKEGKTELWKESYAVHKKAGEELLERAAGIEDFVTSRQANKELEELEKLDDRVLTSGVLSDEEIDEYHQAFLRAEDYVVTKNTNNSWSDEDLDDETAKKYTEAKKYLRKAENAHKLGNHKEAEEFEKKADELSGIKEIAKDAKPDAKQEKVGVVMKEFKEGELKSGSGEKVTNPKQAIAIALSEADKIAKDKEIPEKQDEPEKAGDEVALNKGEEKMADEVKETPAEEKVEETKEEVVEDTCDKAEEEVKPACDEKEDKRKLIDEIGGILKDKLSEEDWRTVIKKAEELAYNDSERSADDEKCEEPKGEVAGDEEEVKVEEKEEEKAEEKEMAKDEALVMDADAIRAEAKAEVIADFKARETARRAVRKMVGDVDVFAFDSADEIYKFACEKAGMNLNEIVSFKDAFQGLSMAKASKLAMDASPVSGSDVECFKDIRLAY